MRISEFYDAVAALAKDSSFSVKVDISTSRKWGRVPRTTEIEYTGFIHYEHGLVSHSSHDPAVVLAKLADQPIQVSREEIDALGDPEELATGAPS